MAIKFIEMYHPETGNRARVSDKAFEQVWSKKGWTLNAPEDDTVHLFQPASDLVSEPVSDPVSDEESETEEE